MDDFEKTVLRRKRHTIAVHLELTDEYIRLFQNSNILNDAMLEQLNQEGSNFQKVMKFLELLPHHCDTKGFQKFCLILERDFEWLADELRAELRAEKGELDIEEYIEKEACTLVFKEFGQTKRLAQNEKTAIKDLIALRTQYAKEVWQRRLDQVQDELRYLRKTNKEKDVYAKDLIEELTAFVRVHKGRLRSKGHGQLTPGQTTQLIMKGTELPALVKHDRHMMIILKEVIDDLIKMASQSLMEKDNLLDERVRALQALKVQNPNAKLDIELELALERVHLELDARKHEVEAREEKARVLREEISNIKRQGQVNLLSKDQVVQTMTMHLSHAHNKVRELQLEMELLRRELQEVQAQSDMWRLRCEKLDKTRRLGYLNPISKGGAQDRSSSEKSSKTDINSNDPKFSPRFINGESKSARKPKKAIAT